MLAIQFNIRNPWCARFDNIKSWSGNTPLKNKFWELEILKTTDVFTVMVRWTHRQDHAGVSFELGVLGYSISFQFYDNRHWDYETGSWVI